MTGVSDEAASARGLRVSFEFFPAHSEKMKAVLWDAVTDIEKWQPTGTSLSTSTTGAVSLTRTALSTMHADL